MKVDIKLTWESRLVGAYRECGKVLELNPENGDVVRVFVDLEAQDTFGVTSMVYHEDRRAYYFASHSGLVECDERGEVLGRHEIDLVDNVAGICIARRPETLEEFAKAESMVESNR